MGARLILLHKQKTSAMVRFLCLPGGLLAFPPMPAGARLREADWAPAVAVHPAPHLAAAAERLGLPAEAIEAEGGFRAWLDTSEGDVPVLMGVFTAIDPPVEAVARAGGRFIPMMEARALSHLDQQLIRRAYEHVLG
ncbi:hypothetical protein G3580_18675 [Nitrogeniibacter mangrovi]|uniref:Uncharacterized protein n=1 Tax=Nitrogeniibacter mangrovi TaxID=2016596 RepID=A0A6C1B9E9_9RHOO|nr:hypothetical protein [Nitrogeniibacter mangrovi]QID19465.1 hypothetical protein G3580_18675 [Nitrogeniibacter mangrovi]